MKHRDEAFGFAILALILAALTIKLCLDVCLDWWAAFYWTMGVLTCAGWLVLAWALLILGWLRLVGKVRQEAESKSPVEVPGRGEVH